MLRWRGSNNQDTYTLAAESLAGDGGAVLHRVRRGKQQHAIGASAAVLHGAGHGGSDSLARTSQISVTVLRRGGRCRQPDAFTKP